MYRKMEPFWLHMILCQLSEWLKNGYFLADFHKQYLDSVWIFVVNQKITSAPLVHHGAEHNPVVQNGTRWCIMQVGGAQHSLVPTRWCTT